MAANDYFDSADYTAIPKHTTGRSAAINGFMQAIENGFTRLPAEARIKQGRVTWGTFGGTANAHTVTLPYPITSYTAGLRIGYIPTLASTAALSVNVDGVGVVSVGRSDGTATVSGDVVANAPLELICTGAGFVVAGATPGQVEQASASAVAAAASAAAAAASYDSFDDRYLGAKAADPTLDNDGAALLAGALYVNTVASHLRFYNGSAWGVSGGGNVSGPMSSINGSLASFDGATGQIIKENGLSVGTVHLLMLPLGII